MSAAYDNYDRELICNMQYKSLRCN